MTDFQQRVVAEKAELDDKLRKLLVFHGTETFAGLPPAEQDRLVRQSNAMEDYSKVLGERIAAF